MQILLLLALNMCWSAGPVAVARNITNNHKDLLSSEKPLNHQTEIPGVLCKLAETAMIGIHNGTMHVKGTAFFFKLPREAKEMIMKSISLWSNACLKRTSIPYMLLIDIWNTWLSGVIKDTQAELKDELIKAETSITHIHEIISMGIANIIRKYNTLSDETKSIMLSVDYINEITTSIIISITTKQDVAIKETKIGMLFANDISDILDMIKMNDDILRHESNSFILSTDRSNKLKTAINQIDKQRMNLRRNFSKLLLEFFNNIRQHQQALQQMNAAILNNENY